MSRWRDYMRGFCAGFDLFPVSRIASQKLCNVTQRENHFSTGEAIASDWKTVGDNLWLVIEQFEHEHGLHRVSAVLIEEGDWWSAQCLEYDIAAQAKTLSDLHYELERVLVSHLCVAEELGSKPFEGLEPAPQKFWDLYKHARTRIEVHTVLRPTEEPGLAGAFPALFISKRLIHSD